MELGFSFFFTNIMLGVGLAMAVLSVSRANGLNEPCMNPHKMAGIAGVFAVFQGLMPMTGWVCVHTVVQYFSAFEKLVPWIALALLGWIGGKMIWDSVKGEQEECDKRPISARLLLVQGVATSIDALSVGFTIAEYNALHALLAVSLIAAVTFVICYAGLMIGKKAGTRLAGKAGILGGIILIAIGIEILLTSLL